MNKIVLMFLMTLIKDCGRQGDFVASASFLGGVFNLF